MKTTPKSMAMHMCWLFSFIILICPSYWMDISGERPGAGGRNLGQGQAGMGGALSCDGPDQLRATRRKAHLDVANAVRVLEDLFDLVRGAFDVFEVGAAHVDHDRGFSGSALHE